MSALYTDRRAAGVVLAGGLKAYANRADVVVLALPRGGVPVAHEVAVALKVPLDVLVVRKLGMPGHEELAMGAIGPGGVRVINPEVVAVFAQPELVLGEVIAREEQELRRREELYREGRMMRSLTGKTVILCDDGLATGASMRAAVAVVKRLGAARIVVAAPVGDRETCARLSREIDDLVCAAMPPNFRGVGFFYDDFAQTTDEEVRRLLDPGAG